MAEDDPCGIWHLRGDDRRRLLWRGRSHRLGPGQLPAPDLENQSHYAEHVQEQLNRGELRFLLSGVKMRGEFVLIRQPRLGGNKWLLPQKGDQYASDADVTLQERSVLLGRRLGEAR